MDTSETDPTVGTFIEGLNQLFTDVDMDAYSRHLQGAKSYGPLGFLENDTLEMAYEELLDLINYARYTAVKVKLLQEAIAQKAAALEGFETTGGNTFVPTADLLKGFDKE